MSRIRVWFLPLLALCAASGCQSSGRASVSADVEWNPSSRGSRNNLTHSAPPPVTVTLCASGLPTEGMWKCDPTFADVNKDGFVDLAAIPRLGKGPRFWLGNGRGEWKESSSGLEYPSETTSCGGGLDLADVNGDEKLDMVVADHCRGIQVYLGDGKGNWNNIVRDLYPSDIMVTETETDMYRGAEDLAAGDIDGDGFLDIVAGSSDNGGINWYRGDGTGKNWTRQASSLPTSGWANRVLVQDINNDKFVDVVASFADGPRVWVNNGKGGLMEYNGGLPSPMIRGLYTGIALGDANEDGRLDIAAANWVDGPEVYLQLEGGTWEKQPDVFTKMYGGSIGLAMGDIDADGHQDIVVAGRLDDNAAGFVRGVFLLHGDGKGNFQYVANSGLPDTGLATTVGLALADVNNDGTLDIAAGSGLIVETNPRGPKAPSIESKLIMWCSHLPARGAALTSDPMDGRNQPR